MRYLLALLATMLLGAVASAEIVTVTDYTADLRSAPSDTESYVVLQMPRYYPLSVQEAEGDFYKVRDYQGNQGWIRKSRVDATRGVVVEVEQAPVRRGPGPEHPLAFQADRGVTLKVLGERDNWLEVAHESGQTGWVYKHLTWGQ